MMGSFLLFADLFLICFVASYRVARRDSLGAQHSGRGGAGNIFKGDEAEQAQHASNDSAVDDKEMPKGLAAKGKALLGLGRKD